MSKNSYVVAIVVVLVGIGAFVYHKRSSQPSGPIASPSPSPSISAKPTTTPESTPTSSATPEATPEPTQPIAEFRQRITKKTFGLYITPATSPVQPERFTGYHTGVDVEYGDVTTDVPVYAVESGKVIVAQWISGYGGLLVLQGTVEGKSMYILFGHLRPTALPSKGSEVEKGAQVGVLGTAYSHETDGERRHLHFAVYTGSSLDIRGYVQKKSELSAWDDPLTLNF